MTGSGIRALASLLLSSCLLLTGCGSGSSADPVSQHLTIWSHGGTPAERTALRDELRRFEAAHPGTTVELSVISEGDYTTRLQAATAARALPDVVDIDGPLVAAFADQGALAPLDRLLATRTLDGQLPTLRSQGTWQGHLWALGTFDSGLGIWADARALHRAGVRVPQDIADAWTADELPGVLAALARHDADGRVLDLKLDYGTGEWLTYGFAPLLASAGGGLEDLCAPQDAQALTTLASWRRFVVPASDPKAFITRRAALSWVGHWVFEDYRAALGGDLVLLPLPDLGSGSRTGSGSWAWAVSATSPRKEAAAALLDHLASDAAVLRMTAANGAIPGTTSALAASSAHADGGPLHLYLRQRQTDAAVPRPVRPDYPALTGAFSTAVHDVLGGTPARAALVKAASEAGQPCVPVTGH